MKSRLFFRENGQVIRTTRSRWHWVGIALLTLAFVAPVVLSVYITQLDEDRMTAAELRREAALEQAYQAGVHDGRAIGEASMIATAEAAWQAAGAEATYRCAGARP